MVDLGTKSYKYFPLSIPGWNCTNKCEVDDCFLLNEYYESIGSYNANCTGKIIDTISDNMENVTQQITLSSKAYQLSLNYYYPRVNALYKTFKVYFN